MTSLLLDVRRPPTVSLVPRWVANDADDAVFLAGSYGLVADDWQHLVLQGWLGLRADGRLAAPRCGLAVPRQNGKNAVLEIAELFKMITQGRKILHTAHEVKTARKAFMRLLSFFDNERMFPELKALVREVRRTNGQEAIFLHNGASVEFIARSKSSGRGFSVDDLVLDEAQELTDDALEALKPTISASNDPQTIYTGTPPSPTAQGEVFTRVRADGLAGASERLCWMDWGLSEDADLDDPDNWLAANPGMPDRLLKENVQDERADFSDDGFARERLGIWQSLRRAQVIPLGLWSDLLDLQSLPVDPVVFSVDITPDRARASISVGARRCDGLLHGEVIDNLPGTDWIVERLVELLGRWRGSTLNLDPSGPAGSLLTGLREHGVEPQLLGTREATQACGEFYDAVVNKHLRHRGDARLTAALEAARKRPVGDAWLWHRKDSTDISPLVSLTNALHGVAVAAAAPSGPKRAVGRVRAH